MPPISEGKLSHGEVSGLGSSKGRETSLGERAGGIPLRTNFPPPLHNLSRESILPAAPALPAVTCGRDRGSVGPTLLPPGGKAWYFPGPQALPSLPSAQTYRWMQTPEPGDGMQRGAPHGEMHTLGKCSASAFLFPLRTGLRPISGLSKIT